MPLARPSPRIRRGWRTTRPDAAQAVAASCRYGQVLRQAQAHYEETNSAGWDLAEDMLAAVATLTGDADPAEVNPDFSGYWLEFPPPGG